METTKPRTVNSIGMFDMLKGAGMLAIVLGHTAELYPLQLEGGLSLTAFVGFIYRETLMAAFFIASGYGFRKRSISKCIHQQLKSLLKPFCYTAVFTTVLHFIIHYKTFHYLPGSMTESIKVAGGFLLGLPHTATYFGQEFFSCGPMWYLLALLMGWILLDVILNIFPERYIPWAVGGAALLGWGASLVWELPFCLIQGAANPKNTHIILAITKDLDVNNVKMSDPTLKPTITIVDGICAAARSSALRSVAKIPFSNLAIYGNRYWNISIHIPRITASTIRIILYILSLPLFRTPMIRKSTNSSMAMTAMTSQQMVAGLKFLL